MAWPTQDLLINTGLAISDEFKKKRKKALKAPVWQSVTFNGIYPRVCFNVDGKFENDEFENGAFVSAYLHLHCKANLLFQNKQK